MQVDYDYFAWDTLNGLGRLKQIKAGPPGDPASLLDLRYFSGINTPAYDAVGNLLNIYDYKTGSPQTQSFQYDALDRLTSAAADGSTGAYAEGYTYDPATGNLSSKSGMSYVYAAQVSSCQGTPATHTIAHAVSTAGGNTYGYDCNGNMTQRTTGAGTYNLSYDAENRLSEVSGAANATFVYDGDGKRVVGTVGGITTTYIGNYFEWSGSSSTMKRYYYAGGTRIAVREGSGGGTSGLSWLLGDHLGSTSVVANSSGGLQSKVLYKAWGEPRYASASLPTQYTFTGQYSYTDDITTPGVTEGFGLMFYNARWYDPYLNRWVQPDSIVPEASQGTQAWDRYAYANNNPVRYTDPSGQMVDDGCQTQGCNAAEGENFRNYVFSVVHNNNERHQNQETLATAGEVASFGLSVVYEPYDWALTANECVSGNCSPLVLLGLLPLIHQSVGKYADDVIDILPLSATAFARETADTILGRAAHTNYPLALGPGYKYNQTLPSGLRPDAVDWQNHVVRELKPDNPRAIQRGWNQVRKYMNELFEITGDVWTAFVDTYNK